MARTQKIPRKRHITDGILAWCAEMFRTQMIDTMLLFNQLLSNHRHSILFASGHFSGHPIDKVDRNAYDLSRFLNYTIEITHIMLMSIIMHPTKMNIHLVNYSHQPGLIVNQIALINFLYARMLIRTR